MTTTPKTLSELFLFYDEEVKPLYSSIQAENALPAELLFEINAAFDHISRHWLPDMQQTEEQVVEKAYSHLKRSCLDVFKLKLKSTMMHYKELSQVEIGVINNGEFEKELKKLVQEIKQKAVEARCTEGRLNNTPDNTEKMFEKWKEVFNKCVILEQDYYYCQHVNWAKKRSFRKNLKGYLLGGLVGVLLTALLQHPIEYVLHCIKQWILSLF